MAGLLRTMIRKSLEFKKNVQMTRAELESFKLRKFRKLVQHAHAHSPYYQRIIKEREIDAATCTPDDFPVLTKELLIEHFDEVVTDRRLNKSVIKEFLSTSTDPNDLLFKEFHVLHTSGSSGQVGYFVFSEEDWGAGLAPRARQPQRSPGRRGFSRPRFAYFGAIGGHFAGVSMASMSKRGIFKYLMKTELYEVNDPLPNVIEQLNEFQPTYLVGYTTAIKILAERQLSGDLQIEPLIVSTGGEAQTEADRELFSRTWNCDVYNGYGCTEHLMMGAARPDGKTMELYDDDLIYEFYDDHSIVTNLFNYTLPLIRYRMSDIIKPVENDSSAEPYLLIHSLVGRSEIVPAFINRDGVEDFISAFTIIELFIPGVSRFQMRLIDKTRFDFAICPEPDLDEDGRADAVAATRIKLQEILVQKEMDNVEFEVLVKDDLPVDQKTGKFKLIVLQQH